MCVLLDKEAVVQGMHFRKASLNCLVSQLVFGLGYLQTIRVGLKLSFN